MFAVGCARALAPLKHTLASVIYKAPLWSAFELIQHTHYHKHGNTSLFGAVTHAVARIRREFLSSNSSGRRACSAPTAADGVWSERYRFHSSPAIWRETKMWRRSGKRTSRSKTVPQQETIYIVYIVNCKLWIGYIESREQKPFSGNRKIPRSRLMTHSHSKGQWKTRRMKRLSHCSGNNLSCSWFFWPLSKPS